MRSILLVLSALTLATPSMAADRLFEAVPREPGRIGLGVGGGTRTTGLSLKYTADKALSFQLVAGVDSGGTNDRGGTLALAGSVLVEMPALFDDPDLEIAWCIGAGPYIAVGDEFWLGAHGVLGLEFNIRVIPLEITLEYRPSLELVGPDGTDIVFVDFGGHIRWWF